MKREITFGQVFGVVVSLVVVLITGWITMNNRVKALEVKADYQERSQQILQEKIDAIQHNTNQILVTLERKQDRK